jgi:CheY-specific phosphatase CheX
MHEFFQKTDPILIECCIALLSSYDVTVVCDGPASRAEIPEEGIVAFTGFTGEAIRGNLVICAPLALICQAMPLGHDDMAEEEQRDWACELSNQLLGRLKLRLSMFGVHFEMTTPSAMAGRELRGRLADKETLVLKFSTESLAFYVELDAMVAPHFEMLATPMLEAVSVLEGELLMLI